MNNFREEVALEEEPKVNCSQEFNKALRHNWSTKDWRI